VIWSYVAVYISFMCLHGVRRAETFVTHVTFVWFLSTVNSAVHNKVTWCRESFSTNSTFKRFLSWMTSRVSVQIMSVAKTFATFHALVFTSMNIHVFTQTALRCKILITFITRMPIISRVTFSVVPQTTFTHKLFVTHCTHIWCWLIIMWMFSDIIIVSFSLHLKATFTCIYHNTTCYCKSSTFADLWICSKWKNLKSPLMLQVKAGTQLHNNTLNGISILTNTWCGIITWFLLYSPWTNRQKIDKS